jgi:hypothetical protein
MLMPLQKR